MWNNLHGKQASRTHTAPTSHSKAWLCVSDWVCMWLFVECSLAGQGISAVSNDEPLVSMTLAQCNAQTVSHTHTWVWVNLMLCMWGNISTLFCLWTDFNDPLWTPTPNTWRKKSQLLEKAAWMHDWMVNWTSVTQSFQKPKMNSVAFFFSF